MEAAMFEHERQLYERHRAEWAKTKAGSWVFIHGDEVSFYSGLLEAVVDATQRTRQEQVFVCEIVEDDQPKFINSIVPVAP